MESRRESIGDDSEGGPRLVLLCGLPGSGKTTIARVLEVHLPAVRLCPDETDLGLDLWDDVVRDRLEARFWRLAQQLLGLGQNVILESGFWLRSDRDEKRLGGQAIGARVEIIVLDVGVDELVRRLERRGAESPAGTVAISRTRLEAMVPFFDRPGDDELRLFDESTVYEGSGIFFEL